MSIFSWGRPRQDISGGNLAKERRLTLTDPGGWAQLFGLESKAGKSVNEKSTLQLATAWACIRLTAMAVSSLPAGLYEKAPDGNRIDRSDHDLAGVLFDSPNSEQTSLEFWESMVGAYAARGNAFAERVYTGSFLSALQPFDGHVVRERGELVFKVQDRGKEENLPADKVFHLKGFALGRSVEGLSPIACGVHSLGSSIAADETASKIFANGLQQPLFIDSGQARLQPLQRQQLTEMFKKFTGSDNTGKVMVLEAGMKPVTLSLNPEDAQMLETRRFNVEEMCRWWGVPPIIVGHAGEGQTMWGSGVEQILLAWLALGINPLCKRIEARVKKSLIGPGGGRRVYMEFNREGLLQMDSKAKAEFLSSMVQNALMTRNEGRGKLNLPKMPGGDQLTAQTNLAPLDQLGANLADPRAAMRAWLGLKD